MICYLDSSVVLRKLLQQKETLAQWPEIKQPFSSRLLRLETLRTIERLHHRRILTDAMTAQFREDLFKLLDNIALLPLTDHIFRRAEQPFATPVGSLDALHLSTALLWRETRGKDFVIATHDQELAQAAKAHGFAVIGISE